MAYLSLLKGKLYSTVFSHLAIPEVGTTKSWYNKPQRSSRNCLFWKIVRVKTFGSTIDGEISTAKTSNFCSDKVHTDCYRVMYIVSLWFCWTPSAVNARLQLQESPELIIKWPGGIMVNYNLMLLSNAYACRDQRMCSNYSVSSKSVRFEVRRFYWYKARVIILQQVCTQGK